MLNDNRLEKIKVLATDIDGTLTDKDYYLSTKAIQAIREIEKKGIPVILVTGNAFVVASTLSHYIGTTGPIVAENGCVVGYKWEPILLADPLKNRNEIIEEMVSLGFEVAPSTRFKYIDLGFKRTNKTRNMSIEEIRVHLEKRGLGELHVTDSGFAVHIAPKEIDKAYGLKEALKLLKVDPEEVAYIGDGENDIPVMKLVGVSATVSDAPMIVKRNVDYIANKPNGEGFSEFIKLILEAKKG